MNPSPIMVKVEIIRLINNEDGMVFTVPDIYTHKLNLMNSRDMIAIGERKNQAEEQSVRLEGQDLIRMGEDLERIATSKIAEIGSAKAYYNKWKDASAVDRDAMPYKCELATYYVTTLTVREAEDLLEECSTTDSRTMQKAVDDYRYADRSFRLRIRDESRGKMSDEQIDAIGEEISTVLRSRMEIIRNPEVFSLVPFLTGGVLST